MNPHIIEDSVSIAAAAIAVNVIAANASLRSMLNVPYPSRGKLIAVESAAGIRIDLTLQDRNVITNAEPRIDTSVQDPLDVINDDFYCNEGDLIALEITNSTAGALTFRYRLVFEPLVGDDWSPGTPFNITEPDTLVMQRGPISVAAAAVDQQMLDGTKFSRLQVPGILRVLMTQSAIGLTRTLFIEQNRISPPSTFPITNRMPQDPFDSSIEGVEVDTGELQLLQVSNPTAGALNVFWKTKFKKLVR